MIEAEVFINLVVSSPGSYVKTHGSKAVASIKNSFDIFKSHEDYIVISEDGKRNHFF